MSISTKKNSHGFTLVEVLVALVILAIGFSTMYLSLGVATHHLMTMQNKTAANWVGLNANAKLRLGVVNPMIITTGTEKIFMNNWNWTSSITTTENEYISKLIVEVSAEGNQNPNIQLTGYLYGLKT